MPRTTFSNKDIYTRYDTCGREEVELLFVGSLISRKGVNILIEAIERLKGEEVIFRLKIAGDGPERFNLERKAKELEILDSVNFMGYIPDPSRLFKLYRNADIFVLPTFSEGFPRVLYEAMGSGLPIITTPVSGISFIMKNKQNALFIRPGSVEDIVLKVKEIVQDKELRRSLIVNGYKIVSAFLDQDHGKQVYELVQKNIVNRL